MQAAAGHDPVSLHQGLQHPFVLLLLLTLRPEDQEIEPGMIFMVNLENDRQLPVRVTKVSDENVTIDLNPPLAGKTLIFKIKVLDIAE